MLLKILSFLGKTTLIFFVSGMVFADIVQAALPLPQFVEKFCRNQGLDICSGEEAPQEQPPVEQEQQAFTESEKEVLTRLLDKEKQLRARQIALDRRERQMKALEEDLQEQISQLETLQQEVEKDIDRKKIQDREQLNKAVEFYDKMEPAKAAASVGQLNTKIAVQILLKVKEKNASAILSEMEPEQAARLIEEIARKR